jgi:hypothetical protein
MNEKPRSCADLLRSKPWIAILPALLLAASASAQIGSIEINQALGVQLNNAHKFVAGKDTVVRAFMTEPVTVDPGSTRAVVRRDGAEVATLEPKSYDGPTPVVDFLCETIQQCGGWAAGAYAFDVTVNGETKSTEGTAYDFVERRELRILALPVRAHYNGTITEPPETWKTMDVFTKRVYPVAAEKVKWTLRGMLDASDSQFNLETDEGQLALWEALAGLNPPYCQADPMADGCYDLIVGFISDRPKGFPNGVLQGYTYGRPANIVVAKDEDAEATVAHEMAHVFGIGDTYDGGSFRCSVNPAPDGYTGKDWDDRSQDVSCTQGRQALEGVSATLVPESQHPYEVGGRGPLGDVACYMGSGGASTQYWTSQETYDHLFNQLAPPTPVRRLKTVQRLIAFSGFIREHAAGASDVQLEPWIAFEDTAAVEDTTGTYEVRAVDASGQVLATQAFDVEFWILNTAPEPPTHINPAPFDGVIRFPEETAKFQIVAGGAVVKEIVVSAHAPVVTAVKPLDPGTTLSGPTTITWTGSDADPDTALTFTVEYNPDPSNEASEWLILAVDHPQTSWTEDFSELPGGNQARIRVTASDGILTGTAESAEFRVPMKAPEAFIFYPEDWENFEVGDEVVLVGTAFDLQDELLGEEPSLSWSSDRDGFLGEGDFLTLDSLSAGEHRITLTAVNRAGMSATASIHVMVGAVTAEWVPADASFPVTIQNSFDDSTIQAVIPAGALPSDAIVILSQDHDPAHEIPPAGYAFLGRNFTLMAFVLQGDEWVPLDGTAQSNGIMVTLDIPSPLPPEVIPNTAAVFRWNKPSGWTSPGADCPAGNGMVGRSNRSIQLEVCRFGSFSLVGQTLAQTYVIPAVAHGPGAQGSQWRTTVGVVNPSDLAASLTLTYLSTGAPITKETSIEPGGYVEWDDVLVNLFGLAPDQVSAGAVWITSNVAVVSMARSYTETDAKTLGQNLPALTSSDALTADKTGILPLLKKTDRFRTNVGVVNLGTGACDVLIQLFDTTGQQVGNDIVLKPGPQQWIQQGDIFGASGAGEREAAYAKVTVKTADGKVWAYGSVVDNATNDPTTVPVVMQ